MAIVFDSSSNSQGTGVTTLTFSHTCSGSDRVLAVVVTSNRAINGVTYNGVSMTQGAVATIFSTDSKVYYLLNPATGANNIVVTIASSGDVIAGGVSFTGADAVGANASGTLAGADTTISTNITTTKDNSFVVCAQGTNGASLLTFTQNSGQTEFFEFNYSTSVALAGAYEQIATAGVTAFQYTTAVSASGFRHALLEIQEKTASPVNSNFLMFM
jgi:hypothetical protein